MPSNATTTTFVAPLCACCPEQATLVPRSDLAAGMAACPRSGQLYRAQGTGYVPAGLPELSHTHSAPSVQIDLSRSGYA